MERCIARRGLVFSCVRRSSSERGGRSSRLQLRVRASYRSGRCCCTQDTTAAEKDGIATTDRNAEESVKVYTDGREDEAAAELFKAAAAPVMPEGLPNSPTVPAAAEEVPPDGDAAVQLSSDNILDQAREIFMFAAPALGIWLSGPIMSLIDTSVVGTSSSIELAALGPGTVVCDGLGYVFMFLSVATAHLIATSMARKDNDEAAEHLGRLLFVALACGLGMVVLINAFSGAMLRAFVGKNTDLIPAAASYVKIRSCAWPVVLATMVAQSACLGMQDSVSPLKVLAITSLVNAAGDVFLCSFFSFGILGAAWATAAAQYVAGVLMLKALADKGYNPFAVVVPRTDDLAHMIEIAAPVLLTMISKVGFYICLIYMATSLGAVTLAAHQVMIGVYTFFSVMGEPLSQTAQSFMPRLLHGRKSVKEARILLKALLTIGTVVGFTLAIGSVSVPFLFPHMFTKDTRIIAQMRSVAVPLVIASMLVPPTLTLEGMLLAARDMGYLGLTMSTCFMSSAVILWVCHKLGLGLLGGWWTLVFFQISRFSLSAARLRSSKGGSLL